MPKYQCMNIILMSKRLEKANLKNNEKVRSILRIINSIETKEGGGFIVHRSFPNHTIREFDPFLLLDEMGPMDVKPNEAKGAPDHPHRGFETVTYMLSGSFEHRDSQGNSGKLSPGDVQWMTAGSGVVHSELPSKEFLRTGGKMHGFQLWVNLPKENKMMKPRYQDIPSKNIPTKINSEGSVRVKILAGKSMGEKAVIDTVIPILYLHFTLKPGSKVLQHVPVNYNTFAYAISGKGYFDFTKRAVQKGQVAIFNNDAEEVIIENPLDSEISLDVLLIGGKPIDEPITRYGPFVMNTKEEIYQAISDYQSGKMGKIGFP